MSEKSCRVEATFICDHCSYRMQIEIAKITNAFTCPSCGAPALEPYKETPRPKTYDPFNDPITRPQHTKRPMAIEWAHRRGFIVRPVGRIYDEQGNYWCRTYRTLSDILLRKGLIKHQDEWFWVDASHPLYVPPERKH
jgi:hypothetical protein